MFIELFIKLKILFIYRKKVHIYINYVHQQIIIPANRWLLALVLNLHLDNFVDSNQDELIKHCMRALRDTLPNEVELTVKVNQIHFNIINIKTKLLFLFRIVLLRLLERIHHLLYWMMLVLVLI
jgi:hypothetical protein